MKAVRCGIPWSRVVAALVFGGAASTGVSGELAANGDRVWATRTLDSLENTAPSTLRCGVDCVFVLAQLQGAETSLADVERAVRVTDRGSSMADLRRGAGELGLDLECVRCGPDGLNRLPLPAIALQEPTASDALNHYVVVLGIMGDRVVLADPATQRIHEVTRASFVRATTGAYLVPASDTASLWLAGLWAAVGVAALAVWGHVRLRPWRALRWARPSRSARVALCAGFLAATTFGCGSAEVEAPAVDFPQDPRAVAIADVRVLEVDATHADLGALEPDASAAATFHLRNTSSRPVKLTTGEPTCNCLAVRLNPADWLAAGAEATLELELNTANRPRGGRLAGSVTVGVARSTEAYTFEASGVLEGLAPGPEYVVRAAHLRTSKIPALMFSILTCHEHTPVSVRSVTVSAWFTDDAALTAADRAAAFSVPLRVRFDKLSASPVQVASGQECFAHDFTLQVDAEGLDRPALGDFVIDYQIGERELSAKIPLIVIAPRP